MLFFLQFLVIFIKKSLQLQLKLEYNIYFYLSRLEFGGIFYFFQ